VHPGSAAQRAARPPDRAGGAVDDAASGPPVDRRACGGPRVTVAPGPPASPREGGRVREEAVGRLRQRVSEDVLATWDGLARTYSSLGPEAAALFEVGADLLAGGKRLRAAFAAAGWRSHGGEPLAAPEITLGTGLELFQVAALVHDDLMDGSLTRRGRPAAHRQLAQRHDDDGLVGGADRFGDAGAILLGDLLLVSATASFAAALDGVGGREAARARAVLEDMMTEVTVGQFLDVYAQSAAWDDDPSVDLDRARRV